MDKFENLMQEVDHQTLVDFLAKKGFIFKGLPKQRGRPRIYVTEEQKELQRKKIQECKNAYLRRKAQEKRDAKNA